MRHFFVSAHPTIVPAAVAFQKKGRKRDDAFSLSQLLLKVYAAKPDR